MLKKQKYLQRRYHGCSPHSWHAFGAEAESVPPSDPHPPPHLQHPTPQRVLLLRVPVTVVAWQLPSNHEHAQTRNGREQASSDDQRGDRDAFGSNGHSPSTTGTPSVLVSCPIKPCDVVWG